MARNHRPENISIPSRVCATPVVMVLNSPLAKPALPAAMVMDTPTMASKPRVLANSMPKGTKASMLSALPVKAGSMEKAMMTMGSRAAPRCPPIFNTLASIALVAPVASMTAKEPPMIRTILAMEATAFMPEGMAVKMSNRVAGFESTM